MNNNNFKIKLPENVITLISAFETCGYEAYVCGGAVRDSLLNREVHDYDLCTNATPAQMMELCDKFEYKYNPSRMTLVFFSLLFSF